VFFLSHILFLGSAFVVVVASFVQGGLPPNASFLFDESKGRGVVASSWPPPPPNAKFGYAGGLGPATLGAQLPLMRAAVSSSSSEHGRQSASFWVDMESSLRTVSCFEYTY